MCADHPSKVFRVFYGMIMPITVIVLLLGIASFNDRPRFLGTPAMDLIIRFYLTVCFCVLYVRLSRISSFSYYPNKRWTKEDVGKNEKYFYLGEIVFLSVGFGIVTWWVIRWFFLGSESLAYVISIINSLIIFFPMVTHYWVLKV